MLKPLKVSLILLLLIYVLEPGLTLGQVEMDFGTGSAQTPFWSILPLSDKKIQT